jgi:glutaredoxin-like YruB-family protein
MNLTSWRLIFSLVDSWAALLSYQFYSWNLSVLSPNKLYNHNIQYILMMAMDKVKIYSSSTCRDCERVKDYLNERGIPFEEINVLKNKQARKEMEHRYGVHVTPVVIVDDYVMVGFNHIKLDKLLHVR